MQRKLVLFDIDGTLLLSGGAGRRALISVMLPTVDNHEIFGQVRFDGKTDPQIITELLEVAGIESPTADSLVTSLADRYLSHLESELDAPGETRPSLMPGVSQLLDCLAEDQRVVLGLLTGNLSRGADLKLRSVGIDPGMFVIGAYGSDSAHRPDLPGIAALRAEPHFGYVPDGEELVIIGDTPADVTCGSSIGARAIGVATGSYSSTDLADAGAYRVFEELLPTDMVLDAIFA